MLSPESGVMTGALVDFSSGGRLAAAGFEESRPLARLIEWVQSVNRC